MTRSVHRLYSSSCAAQKLSINSAGSNLFVMRGEHVVGLLRLVSGLRSEKVFVVGVRSYSKVASCGVLHCSLSSLYHTTPRYSCSIQMRMPNTATDF